MLKGLINIFVTLAEFFSSAPFIHNGIKSFETLQAHRSQLMTKELFYHILELDPGNDTKLHISKFNQYEKNLMCVIGRSQSLSMVQSTFEVINS